MAKWQLTRSTIRVIRVLMIIICTLIALYFAPTLLLRIPSIQSWAGDALSGRLSKTLGTPVEIRRVGMEGWGAIRAFEVDVKDEAQASILRTDTLSLGIELSELIRAKRVVLTSARFFGLSMHLESNSIGRLNIQHILDKLAQDATSTPEDKKLDLAINTFLVRNAQISYKAIGQDTLRVESLNLQLSRFKTSPKLSALVDDLSFRLGNGFSLDHLETMVELEGERLSLQELRGELPDSYIAIPRLDLDLGAKGLNVLRGLEWGELRLSTRALAPFYAPLDSIPIQEIRLRGDVLVGGGKIDVSNLMLTLGDSLRLEAQTRFALDTLGGIDEIDLQISRLATTTHWVDQLSVLVPSTRQSLTPLKALGYLFYNGRLQYAPQRYTLASGVLETELGRWTLQAQEREEESGTRRLEASLRTKSFDARPFLPRSRALGRVEGVMELDIELREGQIAPTGLAMLKLDRCEYGGYLYRNIQVRIDGKKGGHYSLSIDANDPRAKIEAKGGFRLQGEELRDITLHIPRAELSLGYMKLGLSPMLDTLNLRSLNLSLSTTDLDRAEGELSLSGLHLGKGEKSLVLEDIKLQQGLANKVRHLSLETSWLRGEIEGEYRWRELPRSILRSLYRQMPSLEALMPYIGGQEQSSELALRLQVDSLPSGLIDFFSLPIQHLDGLSLMAGYRSDREDLWVNLVTRELRLADKHLRHFELRFQPRQLWLSCDYLSEGVWLSGASLGLGAHGDDLSLNLDLGIDDKGAENGRLQLRSHITSSPSAKSLTDLKANITILPSRLRLHTAYWDIAPAEISLTKSELGVQGLRLSTEGRTLSIEGGLGELTHKALNIDVRNINLRYILGALGVDFDLIDTDLTGTVRAEVKESGLEAISRVKSPGFFVLGHSVGAIDIGLEFNTRDQLIRLNGDVMQDHGGRSRVTGWIKPANGAGIDLSLATDSLDASFVGRFLDNIFTNMEGYSTGKVRLKGLFEEGVTIEGETDIKRGKVSLGVLGTTYFFDHHFVIEEDRFRFDRVHLRDEEGHSGLLDGYITHEYFDKFQINLRGDSIQGLKVLNTSSPREMPIYGVAYASGSASMKSSGDRLGISVNLRSESGTDVTLDFNPTSSGKDEQLLRFVRLRPDSLLRDLVAIEAPALQSTTAIDLALKFNVTPDAKLGMRLSSDMTSELKGQASGSLQIDVPSQGDATVYGSLSVHSGTFAFRFKELAHKLFTLNEGGQVSFRGDPTRAHLDLSASYNLTANIADLDDQLSSLTGRSTIPVTCLVQLSGNAAQLGLDFDLKLPALDSDVERRVRSLLNTKDAMMRQMLYLIALGKFYPESGNAKTDNLTAVASSALSEQLSYLLGNLSSQFNIGTNIKTSNTAFRETDIELLFSGSLLDNRLLINGNIGYHNNLYLDNEYLGEFDIEYKLNRSGSFRLKGYNRYNTMYQYLRQSRMTQGLGFLVRKRFDRLSDLWRKTPSLKAQPSVLVERKEENTSPTEEPSKEE